MNRKSQLKIYDLTDKLLDVADTLKEPIQISEIKIELIEKQIDKLIAEVNLMADL